jgi:calcineurin-like phosphoesterase family protein
MEGNIYFTSDTHYGHTNIAGPSVSEWESGYRDFESVEQMNKTIVENINKTVGEDDVLCHLGDWSFGGKDNIWEFRKQLKCRSIVLILGNHDHHIEKNGQHKIEREEREHYNSYGFVESANNYNSGIVRYRDLFLGVSYVKSIKIKKQTFFLSHFAHRVWDKSHHGVIHLYGHSHGSIPDYGKSMDVGIDVARRLTGEYRPFHITEILEIMDKRAIEFPDHHHRGTNQ